MASTNLTQLTTESPAYSFIEYFLRLNLHASTARITHSWEVSNPQLTLQFEKRSKNVLTIDSWVDVSQLATPNTEDDILKKGFQFSSTGAGMKFNVGRISVDDSPRGKITKRFLLCKIAVGRAYNSAEDFCKVAAVPDGYDSFVIDRVGLGGDSNEECEQEKYEYIIKDAAQILPTYVVVFEYDPEAEIRSRQKVLCENCESSAATVFCQADAANLCANCDEAMHSTKLASRHTRVPLDNGPQTFSNCRIHPDKVVEFFCPACSKPVCVHCKMIGHHSTGDSARHKLITVAEAYKSVSESAKAIDPILDSRKKEIGAQVGAVLERAKLVQSNAADIQEQLEEIYKKAVNDLKAITKKKLNILRGDRVELYREMKEISQLEEFLHYQQSGGNATQFILDWTHHQRLRTELHSFPFFRAGIDVQPDIKINGGIQVHVENMIGGMSIAMDQQFMSSPLGGPAGGAMNGGPDQYSGKQNSLFDKPRYSSSRARATPTFDLTGFKTRKASDFINESLASVQLGSSAACGSSTLATNTTNASAANSSMPPSPSSSATGASSTRN